MARIRFLIGIFLCTLAEAAQPEYSQDLPSPDSSKDLYDLVSKAAMGLSDPQKIVTSLAEPDGRHVKSILGWLMAERRDEVSLRGREFSAIRTPFTPSPMCRLLIPALERVGTAECFTGLLEIARNHPDPQIRGLCLKSLASGFPDWSKIGRIAPDKSLLLHFFTSSGDTLMISGARMRVGDIAREGLRRWAARGSTIPVPSRLRISEHPKAELKTQYWEHWWRTRSPRITWEPQTGRFFLPR